MNRNILNKEVQEFIRKNINADTTKIILKKSPFVNVSGKEIAIQIEGLKKTKKKLPKWHNTKGIYFPQKLSIEQSSSEKTAQYKSSLVFGDTLIDLTGGLGVDCSYFCDKISRVTHCEINTELSTIAKHNFHCLKKNNITCYNGDGVSFIKNNNTIYDWIYVDPARRDEKLKRVHNLSNSTPDIPLHLDLLFQHTRNILIKTAPLFDIKQGIKELQFVKEVHVVSVDNECRELLFLLKKDYNTNPIIKTINFAHTISQEFTFSFEEEQSSTCVYSEPQEYLYEPNTSILKAGAFQSIAMKYNVSKLNANTHLYTSTQLIENFPGRIFKIKQTLSYNIKTLKALLLSKKANISSRNFPLTVEQIRKKTKLHDGGDIYLFFTRSINNKSVIIITEKVSNRM